MARVRGKDAPGRWIGFVSQERAWPCPRERCARAMDWVCFAGEGVARVRGKDTPRRADWVCFAGDGVARVRGKDAPRRADWVCFEDGIVRPKIWAWDRARPLDISRIAGGQVAPELSV